jgi:hypothetical protein
LSRPFRIIIHDATDASTLVNVGATPTGVPVWVNRYYLEADVPEAEDGDYVMWAFVAHRQLFPASLEGVRGRALRDLVEQSMARWHPSLRRLVAPSDEKTVEPFVFEAAPIKLAEHQRHVAGRRHPRDAASGCMSGNTALRDANLLVVPWSRWSAEWRPLHRRCTPTKGRCSPTDSRSSRVPA